MSEQWYCPEGTVLLFWRPYVCLHVYLGGEWFPAHGPVRPLFSVAQYHFFRCSA